MSKRYKLIKEYPNSPKLGSVIIDTNPNNGAKDCWFSPEFWEEVVEKEFEVIKYDRLAYGVFTISYDINTVKRLSDNTIFSIGDKIKVENSHVDKPEAITKIELNKEGTPCLYTKSFHNNGVNIFKAIKCEKLFTTEDGVDIFNGDNYWFAVESDLEILKAWTPRLHVCDWDYSGEYKKPPLGNVQFSTEKAAKDYIEMNKPQYSMKDILNASNELPNPNGYSSSVRIININKLK